jgi:hypothetical protein
MGIQKTPPPAQDDASEPTSPKLPAKSTKSSVTTRSRKAKKPEEDDLPYHPPSRKGKRRAVDENPVTESKSTPADSTEAVDVSPPPKKRAKTRAKKVPADGSAEKKAKAQAKKAPADGDVEKRKKPWLDEAPLDHKVKLVRLASKVSRYLPLSPNFPLPIVSVITRSIVFSDCFSPGTK